ncbi:MAG TPA: L-histidine N(alpha)-methyltransferase [Solirubrobacteraceae bacterium]|nr:L-histidine N(alpha)-methyltransferase [Solirubrobacteraceae bacterium]
MSPRTRTAPGPISVDHAFSDAGARTLAEDALDGLTQPFKEIPPKHFYDSRGAALFEQITELHEYYPTRTERAILERNADQIVAENGAGELVELGAGSATKTRILLDAMARAGTLRRYVGVDVTESAVRESAASLIEEYPGLRVHGLIGDFERHLDRLPPAIARRLFVFLGGTIGNFRPGSRRRFLRTISGLMDPDDRLLLGTDLVKDRATLEAAYNDSAGVTAEFNRNVLHVLNRELGASFDPGEFDHVAFFDPENEWIEMRLRARSPQSSDVPGIDLRVEFAAGEELRTEISAKFTRERVERDLAASRLALTGWFSDERGWFALSLSKPR